MLLCWDEAGHFEIIVALFYHMFRIIFNKATDSGRLSA
jgi:hypothetical protein